MPFAPFHFRLHPKLRDCSLCILLYPLYVWLLGYYTPSLVLQFLLALPASWFPGRSLKRYLEVRETRINRLLFGQFLQMITSELAGGKTWIPAMRQVTRDLVQLNGDSLPFLRTLTACNQQIQTQIPLVDALRNWAASVPCTEAKPILLALASQMKQQGEIQDLIKFSNAMIQELNDLENELASENGKQLAEAFLLNLMPLALSILLHSTASSYMAQAFSSLLGQGLLLLALGLSVLGTSLSLQFAGAAFRQAAFPAPKASRRWRRLFENSPHFQRWGWAILQHFPRPRLLALQSALHQLGAQPPTSEEEVIEMRLLRFGSAFVPLLLFGTGFSALLLGKGVLPWVAFPIPLVVLFIAYVQEPLRQAQSCRQSILLSFPLFSGLISAFLRSGFVPRRAVELCLDPLSNPDTVWGRELQQLRQKLQLQQGWDACLLRIAHGVQIPEIQAALTLLVQYGRNGSADTLTLFVIQSEMCWRVCRNTLRKKREQESLRILIPMLLHLLSVIALTVAPVVAQFQTGSA